MAFLRSRWKRAFLVAPLAAPLVYGARRLLQAWADAGRRPSATQNFLSGMGVILAFGAPLAYAAALGLGAPALWLLRRAGQLRWWPLLLVGALVGLAVALVLTPRLQGDLIGVPLGPWRGALLGASSAGVWGWLALPWESAPDQAGAPQEEDA